MNILENMYNRSFRHPFKKALQLIYTADHKVGFKHSAMGSSQQTYIYTISLKQPGLFAFVCTIGQGCGCGNLRS